MEYYNSAEQVVHRGRPQKKQSVQKSSSDSGTMGKTPAVSATQCNGGRYTLYSMMFVHCIPLLTGLELHKVQYQ